MAADCITAWQLFEADRRTWSSAPSIHCRWLPVTAFMIIRLAEDQQKVAPIMGTHT